MPQVSKYRLDKTVQDEMFQRFWSSIANLQSSQAVSEFFSDLLTDTEEIMLAKRLTAAVLFLRGKRPIDIARALHVSFSLVGRVSTWVDRAKPSTRWELERMTKEVKWLTFLDRIDEILDRLPPRYGTDWSKAGKAKWQRKMERNARQSIR